MSIHPDVERPGPEPTDGGPPDGELVARTVDGDLTAFDVLVNRYQRRAVSASYRLLGNIHDAAEVCQDAFLRAYQSIGTLKERDRFGPWLMRIVSNLSLNYRRSRKAASRAGALPIDDVLRDDEASVSPTAETALAPGGAGELAEVVQKAIEELPDKQRLALVLFAVEGWPQKDVAEILGCSLEVVKWNVFQARRTLKLKLAEYL